MEQKGRNGVTGPRSSKEGTPWLVCRHNLQSVGGGAQLGLMAGAGSAEGSLGLELRLFSAAA